MPHAHDIIVVDDDCDECPRPLPLSVLPVAYIQQVWEMAQEPDFNGYVYGPAISICFSPIEWTILHLLQSGI